MHSITFWGAFSAQCNVKKWQSAEITGTGEAGMKGVESADPFRNVTARLEASPRVAPSPLAPRGIFQEGS